MDILIGYMRLQLLNWPALSYTLECDLAEAE